MVKHLRQIPLDTYKPLREVVIENIRDAILSGDFPAGMRLTELQLADEMGVSRTPIREAIRNLEQEGLVVMIPSCGWLPGLGSGKPSATWNRKALWS